MSDGPIELLATRPATHDSILGGLNGTYSAQHLKVWETDHVLLDTFDRLLRDEGWTLAHEHGHLALSDLRMLSPVEFGPRCEPPSGPVFARDLPPGPLRDAVAGAIEDRALLPLARLHMRTEAFRIADAQNRTVARVKVLVPQLVSNGGPEIPLSTRLQVEGVLGRADERDEVIAALWPVLGLSEPEQTLPDEVVVADGGHPEGVSSKVAVPLIRYEPAGPAVARVLRALLGVIEANEPGTLADIDPEFLHDYRVSIRRTRAVQRQFKHVFDPDRYAGSRTEFKWLQQATGDSRDLDVYVSGFEGLRRLLPEPIRPDLEPLRVVLERRRAAAHEAMDRALRSDRARKGFEEWKGVLDALDHAPAADRPQAHRPIGEYSAQRIRKMYRRMVKMGRALEPGSPPEQFHELRKKGKELRYLLELFGQPLYDPDVVKPMIKTLKSLQDVLGHHQDLEVQMATLRSLADEVAGLPGGPRALIATGVLTARLEQDAVQTRQRFAEVFKEFAAKKQRKLVRQTFA